jgi:type II secretory pathway pseudopilin PulG
MTLVEVLIVLMILAVMAAVTVPRWSLSVQSAQLRSAAITLQSHIGHARQSAFQSGRAVTISFNNLADSYESSDVGFPDQPGSTLSVNLPAMFGEPINMTASFDSGTVLTFDAEGTPRSGTQLLVDGHIELLLNGESRRVRVTPDTSLNSVSTANLP